MIISWRVVAIDSSGARIIIDEGLTVERAHEIRDLMLEKGHNAIVEAEVPPEINGHADVISEEAHWSSVDPGGRRADITLSEHS